MLSLGFPCLLLPAIQYFINAVRNCTSRLKSLPTTAEQLVIVGFVMPNVGDDGEADGVFVQFLPQGWAPEAAVLFQTGMLSVLLFTGGHDWWKGFGDPGGESIKKVFVELSPPFGFAFSAP